MNDNPRQTIATMDYRGLRVLFLVITYKVTHRLSAYAKV